MGIVPMAKTMKTIKSRMDLLEMRMRDLEEWVRGVEDDLYIRIRKLEKKVTKLCKNT